MRLCEAKSPDTLQYFLKFANVSNLLSSTIQIESNEIIKILPSCVGFIYKLVSNDKFKTLDNITFESLICSLKDLVNFKN